MESNEKIDMESTVQLTFNQVVICAHVIIELNQCSKNCSALKKYAQEIGH